MGRATRRGAAGDSVRRGQLLAGIYSPDLLATQQELLIALGSNDPQLIEATRRRLALFGCRKRRSRALKKINRWRGEWTTTHRWTGM